MLEAVNDLSPPMAVSTLRLDIERQRYIAEAESIGSIPSPTATVGKSKSASRRASLGTDAGMAILLDKLGERIAFERTGTRLYGALITKYLALKNAGVPLLLPETALETLQRIRSDELRHFHTLCEIVSSLGGDPTVQTPCADVTAAASMGLVQVLTDPRTTFAQCLNAILTAELTDNAGWELLSELAESAGQAQLRESFAEALGAEQEHLVIVRDWLKALTTHF